MQIACHASLLHFHGPGKSGLIDSESQLLSQCQHNPSKQQIRIKHEPEPCTTVERTTRCQASKPSKPMGAGTPTSSQSATEELDSRAAAADQLRQAVQVSLRSSVPDGCASNSSSASCQGNAAHATADQHSQSADALICPVPANCSDPKLLARALAQQLRTSRLAFSSSTAAGNGVLRSTPIACRAYVGT